MARMGKQAKIDFIIETMIENPGAHTRRGFNLRTIRMMEEKKQVKVDPGYMSRLVKEARALIEKREKYFMAKKDYQLQHQRLLSDLKKAQDGLGKKVDIAALVNLTDAQGRQLEKMEKMDGHLKDVHVFEGGDAEKSKEAEDYFDDTVKGEKKAATKRKPGGDHGQV